MHFDGFKDIVNVDLSGVVIQQMIDKTQSLNGLSWQVMDARYMELDDESFDAVLDKGMVSCHREGRERERVGRVGYIHYKCEGRDDPSQLPFPTQLT